MASEEYNRPRTLGGKRKAVLEKIRADQRAQDLEELERIKKLASANSLPRGG